MARTAEATELMLRFAERTGLTASAAAAAARPPQRYLWTDAFAVCNLVALGRLDLAEALVTQVHDTLGRHRADDPDGGRAGRRLAPADDARPTRGGLRIGKPLPERPRPAAGADEEDDEMEWERDGQYFHYLTRWAHALDRVCRATGDPRYAAWSRDLMCAAHAAFVVPPPPPSSGGGGKARQRAPAGRMYWKMSVDLARPAVRSQGQHDPLDGLVTCLQLQDTAAQLGDAGADAATAGVECARRDFEAMVRGGGRGSMATGDALGVGGLLTDACRLDQILGRHPPQAQLEEQYRDVRDAVWRAGVAGVAAVVASRQLDRPPARRLAFRELGMAIGLAAVTHGWARPRGEVKEGEVVKNFGEVRDAIEDCWLRPENRAVEAWGEHRDINEVMLATCLVPQGYLLLPALRLRRQHLDSSS